MNRRCAKCHKEMDEALIICPHCGAICGAPVNLYKKARKRVNIPWRFALPALTVVLVIICAVLL